MTNAVLGKRLKEIREKRGFSQRELAEKTNIAEKMIWRYENDKSEPGATNLLRLVRELNITSDYLIGAADEAHLVLAGDKKEGIEYQLTSYLNKTYGYYREMGMPDQEILINTFKDYIRLIAMVNEQAKFKLDSIEESIFMTEFYVHETTEEPPDFPDIEQEPPPWTSND